MVLNEQGFVLVGEYTFPWVELVAETVVVEVAESARVYIGKAVQPTTEVGWLLVGAKHRPEVLVVHHLHPRPASHTGAS